MGGAIRIATNVLLQIKSCSTNPEDTTLSTGFPLGVPSTSHFPPPTIRAGFPDLPKLDVIKGRLLVILEECMAS